MSGIPCMTRFFIGYLQNMLSSIEFCHVLAYDHDHIHHILMLVFELVSLNSGSWPKENDVSNN